MRDSRNGHYVLCPLCEGKGRIKRSELAARLASHDVEDKLTACRQQVVKMDGGGPETALKTTSFHEEVVEGPATRILWRRSPKE